MPRVTPITWTLIAAAAAWPLAAQAQTTSNPPISAQQQPRPVSSALDTSYIRAAMRDNLT